MSDTYFSLAIPGRVTPNDVTVGTSTSGQIIEVRVRDGSGLTRKDLFHALRTIEGAIIKRGAPA